MKGACLLALVMVSGAMATNDAFAKPSSMDMAVAAQKSGKPVTQIRNSSAAPHVPYVVTQKTGKPGSKSAGTKKSISSINGTGIRSKHWPPI